MVIKITDDFELHGDELQWQIYQRREVNGKDGESRLDWVALPSYHGRIEYALLDIQDRLLRTQKGERATISAALEELRELQDDIRKTARRFEKGLEANR